MVQLLRIGELTKEEDKEIEDRVKEIFESGVEVGKSKKESEIEKKKKLIGMCKRK
jgi:hypothetical protein